MRNRDIQTLLNPKSIAIVGASRNPEKWGANILSNILGAGFGGRVYPINPKETEIMGLPAYKSMSDIPDEIDMISVSVEAALVPQIIRQAVEKKVKSAVIFSAGFREAGRRDLEEEIMAIARGTGLRILGPNLQGIINTGSRMSNIFNMVHPKAGNVAVVAQSGSVSEYVTEKMDYANIGISALINLGNQLDLCESDFLSYFAQDPGTDVIALYLEGPKDNARFKETLINVAKVKPVVIMKPGSTQAGQSAAASHTGSIAGNDSIFTHACRQFGALRCANMTEYIDTLMGFAALARPRGNRVLLLTTSGGVGSIAVDELSRRGFALARLPEEAVSELKQRTGKKSGIGDMMDLTVDVGHFETVTQTICQAYEDHLDSYFFMVADGAKGLDEVMVRLARSTRKPVMMVYMSEGEIKQRAVSRLAAERIPMYETPERAAQVLYNLLWYDQWRGRQAGL